MMPLLLLHKIKIKILRSRSYPPTPLKNFGPHPDLKSSANIVRHPKEVIDMHPFCIEHPTLCAVIVALLHWIAMRLGR